MSDFKLRLFQEYSDLQSKIEKLEKFILGDVYDTLPDVDKKDLKEQLKHMNEYCRILSYRVSRQCNSA